MIRALASLALALVAPPVAAQDCIDADIRERARALMLEGIDAGLRAHTTKIFDNWLRDPSGQPARAARGIRNGIAAYEHSRTQVLKWSPPVCAPIGKQ